MTLFSHQCTPFTVQADHGAEATEALKAFIGEYYVFSDKPAFQALWDNYNACQFVEDDGDILFYRDKKGEALLRPATEGQH
ncbi:hypothetical protein FB451DRAFT_1406437 [Mycena latifolia]|nr:hypothetical protein FB451DRAFT_1406437 [Mycena latifolia]